MYIRGVYSFMELMLAFPSQKFDEGFDLRRTPYKCYFIYQLQT